MSYKLDVITIDLVAPNMAKAFDEAYKIVKEQEDVYDFNLEFKTILALCRYDREPTYRYFFYVQYK